MPILVPPLPLIGLSRAEWKTAQKVALNYCKTTFAGRAYLNISSGDAIVVTANGLKHTLHNAMSARIRASYVLPQILENAELTGVVPDKHGRPDIMSVRKYEIEMLDGTTLLIALVVAFQYRTGLISFYDLSFLQR